MSFFIKRNPHDGTTEGPIWWKRLWAGRENSRTAQPEQACDITKPFPADPWPPGPLDRRGAQRRPILHSLAPAGHKPLTLYWQRVDTRLNLIFELFHTALGICFFFCRTVIIKRILRAELLLLLTSFVFLPVFLEIFVTLPEVLVVYNVILMSIWSYWPKLEKKIDSPSKLSL